VKCQEVEFSQSHYLFGTPCQFHSCAYQSQTKMKQSPQILENIQYLQIKCIKVFENFKYSRDKPISINVIA
jgi:hypothetical protein